MFIVEVVVVVIILTTITIIVVVVVAVVFFGFIGAPILIVLRFCHNFGAKVEMSHHHS